MKLYYVLDHDDPTIEIVSGNNKTNTTENLLMKGDGMNLTCRPHGFPVPSVQWYKDGMKLMDFKNVLFIQDLSENDAGLYQCRSLNKVSEKSATKFLTVYCK